MADPRLVFYFDFVDPGSHVAASLICGTGAGELVEWRAFELRPPPRAPIDPADPAWRSHHARIARLAFDLPVTVGYPDLIPWTRKAHELLVFAREMDCDPTVTRALFEAHFVDGIDIGRIDSLVEIAHRGGLLRTPTRAVLDVDRYADVVRGHREAAQAHGITTIPTLVVDGRRWLEGLTGPADVERWRRWAEDGPLTPNWR